MSLTTSLCLSLLVSGGPKIEAPSPSEETAAIEWLKSANVLTPSKNLIQDTLTQWQVWKTATPRARAANLALELRAISPGEAGPVFALNQRQALKELSAANLERLKNQLTEKYPLMGEPPASVKAQIRSMSDDIDFHYLRRYAVTKETGVHAPLASSRELAKRGWDFNPSFYSKLVGNSPSVGFTVIATKKKVGPLSLNAQVPFDAVRLTDELANEEGFFVPNFSNAIALMNFFGRWDPPMLERLLRQNAMSLPASVNTVDKFILYLDPMRLKVVFPDEKVFERLAVLRERLHRFVLTETDLRSLLLWAFERYLTGVALSDSQEFGRLLREFSLPAGPQSVMANQFQKYLGLGDLSLRIPLAVGPQSYSILRIETRAYNPFPSRDFKPQAPWDSRRLDHTTKP